MELFDYIKLLFSRSKQKEWADLDSSTKIKYQFMLNRFMGIQYPINAQQLNQLKTSGLGVAETWRGVASRFWGDKVPAFIYTKLNKNKTATTSPLSSITQEAIDIWCEKHECGDKEFKSYLQFYEKDLIKELMYINNNLINKQDE